MVSGRSRQGAARARPVVLVTGFEAFGGDPLNPSEAIARSLHGRSIAGHRVVGLCLPTVFGQGSEALRAAVQRLRPAWVFALGLAARRTCISLERVAVNVVDARLADNAGAQPVDVPVVPGAPVAYFSGLPIKAMLAALQEAQVPAEVSNSAGTFVCNELFFRLMHALNTQRDLAACRGGFVHVPATVELGGGFTHEALVVALRTAIAAAVIHARRQRQDLVLAAGHTA